MNEGRERGPILLDTEVFIWAVAAPERLSDTARAACESADFEVCVSVASLWEIVIKAQSGKLDIEDPVGWFVKWSSDFRLLSITARDVMELARMPWIHKDPFDRIILAQAIQNRMPLVTCDRQIHQYPSVALLW